MDALGTEQQLGKRQLEQRAHIGARPVVANRRRFWLVRFAVRSSIRRTMAVLQCKSKRPRSLSSAATCAPAPAGSTRAAQYLNSGIFPNGSSAGLVRRFAAASTNANGMNTTPSGIASSWRATSSMVPRRVVTRTMSPGATPSCCQLIARQRRHRAGLDLVEHGGAPGHRAGVPMLELAAGGENERELRVGLLVGRCELRRHQLAEPAGTREAVGEHDVVARLVGRVGRIGHRAFALDPLPRDVVERGHQRRHLGIDLARMRVVPRQPDAPWRSPG